MKKPQKFTDVMLQGSFRSFRHQHIFKMEGENTIMIDVLEFESPFGIIGKIFNFIFLKNYMKIFLSERNQLIKSISEMNSKSNSENINY